MSDNLNNTGDGGMQDNIRIYDLARSVPSDAIKPIRAGRLKGKSDINPMWRMKRMTEIFGPCGLGWKYTLDRQWSETYGDEVKCYCNISLYVRDPQTHQWSDAIPGTGGSALVKKESGGFYVDDEGYKMALTDALSIAMKPLGIGADIWYGSNATGHNESKYEQYQQPQAASIKANNQMVFTAEQLQQAIKELRAADTVDKYYAVYNKWASEAPAICQQDTDFYAACIEKARQLNLS